MKAHIYERGSVDYEEKHSYIVEDKPEEHDFTVDDEFLLKLQMNDASLTAQTVKSIQEEYIIFCDIIVWSKLYLTI